MLRDFGSESPLGWGSARLQPCEKESQEEAASAAAHNFAGRTSSVSRDATAAKAGRLTALLGTAEAVPFHRCRGQVR